MGSLKQHNQDYSFKIKMNSQMGFPSLRGKKKSLQVGEDVVALLKSSNQRGASQEKVAVAERILRLFGWSHCAVCKAT